MPGRYGELPTLFAAQANTGQIVIFVFDESVSSARQLDDEFVSARADLAKVRPVVTVLVSQNGFQELDLESYKKSCDVLVCPDALWLVPEGRLRLGAAIPIFAQLKEWCSDWFEHRDDSKRTIFIDLGANVVEEGRWNMKISPNYGPVEALDLVAQALISNDMVNPPARRMVKRHTHKTKCVHLPPRHR